MLLGFGSTLAKFTSSVGQSARSISVKAFFILLSLLSSAHLCFAIEAGGTDAFRGIKDGPTFQRAIEASTVYVQYPHVGNTPEAAIRLNIVNKQNPRLVVDYWKSGIVRRIAEVPMKEMPQDSLNAYSWKFPIEENHKLGANTYWSESYTNPESFIAHTSKSDGIAWVKIKNVEILKTGRKFQKASGREAQASLSLGDRNSSGGILFSNFVYGNYIKPAYFKDCELYLMK
jgi:hypothetical protein